MTTHIRCSARSRPLSTALVPPHSSQPCPECRAEKRIADPLTTRRSLCSVPLAQGHLGRERTARASRRQRRSGSRGSGKHEGAQSISKFFSEHKEAELDTLALSQLVRHTSIGPDGRKTSAWMNCSQITLRDDPTSTHADWAGRLVILVRLVFRRLPNREAEADGLCRLHSR